MVSAPPHLRQRLQSSPYFSDVRPGVPQAIVQSLGRTEQVSLLINCQLAEIASMLFKSPDIKGQKSARVEILAIGTAPDDLIERVCGALTQYADFVDPGDSSSDGTTILANASATNASSGISHGRAVPRRRAFRRPSSFLKPLGVRSVLTAWKTRFSQRTGVARRCIRACML